MLMVNQLSLNPCFIGSSSQSWAHQNYDNSKKVLILVLLDLVHRVVKEDNSKARIDAVLILVLLDLVHRDCS